MDSYVSDEVFYTPGEEVLLTVDIKTDAGSIHLFHETAAVVESDYRHIVQVLQPAMFRVE